MCVCVCVCVCVCLKSGRVELSQNSLQLNDIHNGSALGLLLISSLSCNEFCLNSTQPDYSSFFMVGMCKRDIPVTGSARPRILSAASFLFIPSKATITLLYEAAGSWSMT